MIKILVCGDRNWTNERVIKDFIEKLPDDVIIIHGNCRGADLIAGKYSLNRGLTVITYPADWERYGKSAGPIRNKEMLDEEPHLVIAFHNNIEKSKGTKNMIEQAKKANINVFVINEKSEMKSF